MKQVVRTVFENGEVIELSVRRPSPDQIGGRNRNYNIRSAAIHKVYALHPSIMSSKLNPWKRPEGVLFSSFRIFEWEA